MYLEPWQIFLIGVVVGMFLLLSIEIIFVVTHIKPVSIKEEMTDGELRDKSSDE